MTNIEHQVIIAGAGPTGLMLACELALAHVDVAIIEKREGPGVDGWRVGGLNSRALEVLDQRGIVDRFLAQGPKHHAVSFAGVVMDARDRSTRHNYTLGLWQDKIEQTLAERAEELAVEIYRGSELKTFAESDGGIDVQLRDGRVFRCRYLVGCDGGESVVRKAAGIAFPGWDAQTSCLVFEGKMADETPLGISYGAKGIYALGKVAEDGQVRGVVTEQVLNRSGRADVDDLRNVLTASYGSDLGVHDVTWVARFSDEARQAAFYRKGRVLLAGDAAHLHSPVGGQGLNVGLQDAVNLGWKLAQVIHGHSRDSLLDTYHAERHPVGQQLLSRALALATFAKGDDWTTALRLFTATIMQMDEPRKWYAATMSGLDIRYGPEAGHPLVGRRMPDLEIVTTEGFGRVYELLHDARPVLLNFSRDGSDAGVWAEGRVRPVDAIFSGICELPVIGVVPTPSAVLIRPDGYVAWVGQGNPDGLTEAIETWF